MRTFLKWNYLAWTLGSLFLWATPALRADPTFEWKATAGGAWGDGNNWTLISGMGSFPNSADAVAIFPTPLVNPMGNDQTVTLNVPPTLTVGQIDFNHFAKYTLAAAGASLTFDSTSAAAQVNVLQGAHTISAPIKLNDPLVVTTALGTTLTFSGGLADMGGPRDLTKRGEGTLIFAGGSYSGHTGATNVEKGLLQVVGVNMSNSHVTVQSGATFQGTGTVGNVTALAPEEGAQSLATLQSSSTVVTLQQTDARSGRGGTLIIGLSPGILNVMGDLILQFDSNLDVELDGSDPTPTPGLHYDQVVVTGHTVQLDDANLLLSLGPKYMHLPGRMFTIIDFAAELPASVMGRFADRLAGIPFSVDGQFFLITYEGGDGNDVVLTAIAAPGPAVIPEPSSLVLLSLGSLSLAGYAYRRRKPTA